MTYVDGFVLVVPKKNFNKYKKMATDAGKIWKKFGALEYLECVGDDLNPDMGGMKALNFPKMTKLKKNENVWFSFIIYKNKNHRDSVNKMVMNYFKKMHKDNIDHMKNMPWDMKKFAYGGFKTIVEK
jgi:uncharacterized protein YbaA (DUF1428 family)